MAGEPLIHVDDVPHAWLDRYSSWDLTTKVVKLAAARVARP